MFVISPKKMLRGQKSNHCINVSYIEEAWITKIRGHCHQQAITFPHATWLLRMDKDVREKKDDQSGLTIYLQCNKNQKYLLHLVTSSQKLASGSVIILHVFKSSSWKGVTHFFFGNGNYFCSFWESGKEHVSLLFFFFFS